MQTMKKQFSCHDIIITKEKERSKMSMKKRDIDKIFLKRYPETKRFMG